MRFAKVVLYDLKRGIYSCPCKLFGIGVVYFFILLDKANYLKALNITPSYYLFAVTFQGISPYVPEDKLPFLFPAEWLIAVLPVLCYTLQYPVNDLSGFGKQILLRIADRKIWWYSKCIWLVSSLAVCSILYIILLFIVSFGFRFSFSTDYTQVEEILNLIPLNPQNNIEIQMVCQVFFSLLALCFLQMFFSLMMGTTYSFTFLMVLLLLSTYFMKSYLPGNYLMLIRSAYYMENGIEFLPCLAVDFFIIALSIWGGDRLIRQYNIF